MKPLSRSFARVAGAAILSFLLAACSELHDLRYIKAAQDARIAELARDLEARSGEYQKALTKKQYEIDGLEKRLAAARDEITRLQTQQSERQRAFEIENRRASDNLVAAQRDLSQSREVSERRMRDLEDFKARLADAQADAQAQKSSVASLRKELDKAERKIQSLTDDLKKAEAALAAVRKDLETERKRAAAAPPPVAANADDLAADPDFQDALTQLKARLDPVCKAGSAAVFADSRGVVVRLSADYLFKSGQVDLDSTVFPTLDAIGEILGRFPEKYVDVEGHADSQPVVNLPFLDNWALAATRANKVVRYLAENAEVDPRRLKSVSCSQYRPPKGPGANDPKAQRRVEIVLRSRP
ncbi:OmpA family protein [Candidatus Sumerlaeota bacterium]|nr:OmpA family protein [Candidatus Sumerlaeota bacterium]